MSRLSIERNISVLFAQQLLKMRDTISGLALLRGGRVFSTAELCEYGREAIRLIEEGEVQ